MGWEEMQDEKESFRISLDLWFLVVVFMAITTISGQVRYNLIQFGCMTLLGIGILFWVFRHHVKRLRIAGAVLLACYTALLILRFSGVWTIQDHPLSDGEKVMGILTWLITLYFLLCGKVGKEKE